MKETARRNRLSWCTIMTFRCCENQVWTHDCSKRCTVLIMTVDPTKTKASSCTKTNIRKINCSKFKQDYLNRYCQETSTIQLQHVSASLPPSYASLHSPNKFHLSPSCVCNSSSCSCVVFCVYLYYSILGSSWFPVCCYQKHFGWWNHQSHVQLTAPPESVLILIHP